jgi:formate dehydrogenase maturation protein FdhE
LSTISVSIVRSRSIASASRNSTPACAARPLATMIDIGVARPSAQGHAMISTATALTTA